MPLEQGPSHYIQDELSFHPAFDKDWSHLDNATAEAHLDTLMRRGEAIHGIKMPEVPTPDVSHLRGQKLAHQLAQLHRNGVDIAQLDISHLGPEEPDILPVAKSSAREAQPDLSGREASGLIDVALKAAEMKLDRPLTDQESIHIARKAENAVRNGH